MKVCQQTQAHHCFRYLLSDGLGEPLHHFSRDYPAYFLGPDLLGTPGFLSILLIPSF